ncbi:E3 ubiquitin-protein ligase NEURL3 isoform X2 [Felis catus]|uniref:Neuralized E3 ubiquitin protein ligase 3 n=1 Tax=Felis catus TaxID=9685 RepID=A0ABI7Y7C9_FELCA|nr:E3 ubiquitin-protein ligase NEURL3 isoform X2 [Felis catus]
MGAQLSSQAGAGERGFAFTARDPDCISEPCSLPGREPGVSALGSLRAPKAHTPAADTKAPRETLRFHPEAKGAQVRLDAQRCTARRNATFHDGIVFSQRPVLPGERVAVRVVWHEGGWCGGLRVGFTRLDPARVSAPSLPPFVCPDLELQSPTWAAMLPEGCALAGDVVCFWVNRRGRLFVRVNSGPRLLLRKGVLMGAPLWAVMDVYGTTKAIKLLDPTASAFPSTVPRALINESLQPEATAGEECAICFHHAANTCLVPCGHTHFCSYCALRVFRDLAKCPVCRWEIKAVVPAWGPPILRTGEGLLMQVAN